MAASIWSLLQLTGWDWSKKEYLFSTESLRPFIDF